MPTALVVDLSGDVDAGWFDALTCAFDMRE